MLGIPLIERNLQHLLELGFTDIFASVSVREEELARWLSNRGRQLAATKQSTLQILFEETPLGTIGAAVLLSPRVLDVLVVNVDNLSSLDVAKMTDFHRRREACATIATHREKVAVAYGALVVEGERIVAYREKPIIHVPVSSGTYVLSRRAIDRIRPGARLDAPDLINQLLGAGETVVAYPHQDWWVDVNDEAALSRAESLLLSQPAGAGEEQSDLV